MREQQALADRDGRVLGTHGERLALERVLRIIDGGTA